MKTKIKSHGDKVTDFCDKEIPNMDSTHTCLAIITLHSALKKDENYYPKMLLKECKYIEKNVIRRITEDMDSFSSNSGED